MSSKRYLLVALLGLMSLWPLETTGVWAQEKPRQAVPQPGVPQVVTIEGKFVRAVYNNEGYVILGYQATNRSVGQPWMLLEVGIALRDNVPDYKFTRAAISLETPDGKTIPLPTAPEQRAGNPSAIQQRANVQRDSINYFPPNAARACALLFFPELGARALPYDETELSDDRACVGRLYFPIPGGITYGQHWLNVKFQNSLVRVPFRILTKEEEEFAERTIRTSRSRSKTRSGRRRSELAAAVGLLIGHDRPRNERLWPSPALFPNQPRPGYERTARRRASRCSGTVAIYDTPAGRHRCSSRFRSPR